VNLAAACTECVDKPVRKRPNIGKRRRRATGANTGHSHKRAAERTIQERAAAITSRSEISTVGEDMNLVSVLAETGYSIRSVTPIFEAEVEIEV
jgi:hypothetical protein